MKSEAEMWGELADRIKEIHDLAHKKLLDYFVANRMNKDQIKEQIDDVDTASLKHYLHHVFIGMEEYELCQAFKEVLDERYQNPAKLRAYAESMIQTEMDGIASFRQILGNGFDLGSWNSLFAVLDDKDIRSVFYSIYPIEKLIKLEMAYFKQRHIEGSEVFIDYEIIGDKLMPNSGLVYKLERIYPDAGVKINVSDNSLILTFTNQAGERLEQEYQDFELVYEGKLK